MPLINNIYVFVKDEDIGRSTQIPQHPVEKGLPLTDSIRNEPIELSISGKIVDAGGKTAAQILAEIEKLRTGGSLITYKGRNIVGNFMIKSFDTSHPNTNWGGADFDMELVEVRTAKSAYDPNKQKKKETVKSPSLTVGSIVVFKGGAVYVSSDAKKAAANRGRQTCKITKISKKSWSIHQYHLISTEKKYPNNVYGWVDEANIEGAGATSTTGAKATITSPKTNGGTKQTQTDNKATSTLQQVGTLTANFYVTVANFNKNQEFIDGYGYYRNGVYYYRISSAQRKADNSGRVTTVYFPKGTIIYKKKKK